MFDGIVAKTGAVIPKTPMRINTVRNRRPICWGPGARWPGPQAAVVAGGRNGQALSTTGLARCRCPQRST
jgi:hypothetical protein